MKKFFEKPKWNESLWFYIMISPWIVGFLSFTLGPMIYSIYLSLSKWDLFQPPQYIGLKNYIKLFTMDDIFWKALYNTFYYAIISVPLHLIIATGIAYMLNKKMKGMRIYRTAFYLPSLVPVVASSMLFVWIFAPDTGILNQFLAFFGIDGPAWLLDAAWVKFSLVIMSLWGVGGGIVLLLAGMRGVPDELYEASEIDGAGKRQQFFRITLPMLTPVLFFNLIMGIIGGLQTFAQVYIMTSGGPNNASLMVVPYLYDHAFNFYNMGYGSALAWALFAIIMILTLLVFRSSSMWVYYESEVKS
ncbi:MAG: sugar ABC transporter permease [Halanaerobiales bacterium]|nr:sugar ABC transporter permease [Halanaerobiales bacterium]